MQIKIRDKFIPSYAYVYLFANWLAFQNTTGYIFAKKKSP